MELMSSTRIGAAARISLVAAGEVLFPQCVGALAAEFDRAIQEHQAKLFGRRGEHLGVEVGIAGWGGRRGGHGLELSANGGATVEWGFR